MATTVRKWGNSLGIRLPKAVAEQFQIENGTEVDFDTVDGDLVIRRRARRRSKYKLADLLAKVKGPSPHRELWTDGPIGRELL